MKKGTSIVLLPPNNASKFLFLSFIVLPKIKFQEVTFCLRAQFQHKVVKQILSHTLDSEFVLSVSKSVTWFRAFSKTFIYPPDLF